ncbi:unnamed protein product [Somion occarium]|uniref:Metallothionein n=1 Tax=Somion occarium TaxID=3059160 RepID=A0ABP1DU65_9APHY
MVDTCTCQNNCSACGPSGTGCACPKDKCECADCPNNATKAHAESCACGGSGQGCACGKDCSCGKACTCSGDCTCGGKA